ncbi:MAG: biotin--[acetyl-CoA-carboxylase] ligase [Clostridia bacterium]
MIEPLLALLSTTEYLSGEKLCEQLHMTRGAVWKRIEKLREEGYEIISAGKKGYRLAPAAGSLLPGYIAAELTTRQLGRGEMLYAREMDSTNTRMKELGRAGAPQGSLALCERQTAGRGRLGRAWETPMGEALMQSLLLRPQLSTEQAQLCTLAAAVAMAQAIHDLCPMLEAGIKWPNDLVINGKKCVGILSELSANMDGIEFVVLGAGVNVNQERFEGELAQKATSLLLEVRKTNPSALPLDRRALLLGYLQHMENALEALEQHGLQGILAEYIKRSVTLGSRVHVLGTHTDFAGTARAIDDTGALLVEDEQGKQQRVLSGDVSVRGLMGYC